MPKLIAGNWKMNTLAETAAGLADALKAGVAGVDLLLCPPFVYLATVAKILAGSPVALGAQDCHPESAGAYTGDVAAPMLRDVGCRFVILGHSERRGAHRETDALVRAKVSAAQTAGLAPIACVGESAEERAAGRESEVVAGELAASLPDDFAGEVAYEPIWAIGSGRTPSPDEITRMHQAIRARLVSRFGERAGTMRVLYGGSVNARNAAALLSLAGVGGALVGGASLNAADFLAIALAAAP